MCLIILHGLQATWNVYNTLYIQLYYMILRLQAIAQNKLHGFEVTENVHIVMYHGF